eukprot:scaffold13485_cov110-Isochrysis_galbana.AAC.6
MVVRLRPPSITGGVDGVVAERGREVKEPVDEALHIGTCNGCQSPNAVAGHRRDERAEGVFVQHWGGICSKGVSARLPSATWSARSAR